MNLYEKLCSYGNLLFAYRKARKGKTKKWYVKKFSSGLEKNLMKLEAELKHERYSPHSMKIFSIRDPKTRVISSSHFRDRVVHHAVCNIIEPMFEKTFIHDSYASRRGKGTHAAIKRFDKFKRRVSNNGRLVKGAKDNNMIVGYVLKADIKHYFDTVDHQILLRILRRKISDDRIIRLIETILQNHRTKIKSKGMPIGNLTSQFFANVYLNELDKFVKHKLHAKFYIRYLDDFVILHKDKTLLTRWKGKINDFLTDELKLELHPEKSKIYPLYKGTNFLGFRIFYYYKLPKESNYRLIRKRIRKMKYEYKTGLIKKEDMEKRLEGWVTYAIHGNTYKFCKRLRKEIDNYS